MDDLEVDRLLAEHRPVLSSGVRAAVDDLVTTTRSESIAVEPERRGRRGRAGWTVAAVGAVVLTAAFGLLSSYEINQAPFSTIPDGVQRISTPIPVDYTTTAGEPVACQAYLEFQHLSSGQLDEVESYVDGQDWTSFGQGMYDRAAARLPASSRSAQAVSGELGEVLDPAFADVVTKAAPALRIRDFSSGEPTYNGYAMSCQPGQAGQR